ncbi:MAG: hypothetical protein K6A44_03555 [bacterium]|nr:hypothetical protein [bacterium]
MTNIESINGFLGYEKQVNNFVGTTKNDYAANITSNKITDYFTQDSDATIENNAGTTQTFKAGAGINIAAALQDDNTLGELNKAITTTTAGTIFESKPGFKDTLAGRLLYGSTINENKLGSDNGKNLALMAEMDKDHDGNISDSEAKAETKNGFNRMLYMSCVDEDGNACGCGGSVIKAEHIGLTTVCGQKIYAVTDMYKGLTGSANLSENEMKALDEYYEKNGAKADINGAAKAMGIKIEISTETNNFGQKATVIKFIGASGVESKVSITNISDKIKTADDAFWYLYRLLKTNAPSEYTSNDILESIQMK